MTTTKQTLNQVNELQDALQQHNALLSAIPDLIFLFDENCIVLDCHPHYFSPCHYTNPSQFLGNVIDDALPPDVAKLTRENIVKVLQGAKESYGTYSLDIQEEKQYFESRFVPCGTRQVLAIVRNITDRVNAEIEKDNLQKQLLQSQKMESIGRLAGGIAHDFNNMLGVILSHAEMAIHECEQNPRLQHHLQEITHASERSVLLVKQLLSFARKQTIAPELVDINTAIAQTISMLRRLIGENIDLVFQPGDDVGVVYIDPAQIDQILTNLSINARDAIHGNGDATKGGSIVIETDNVTLDTEYCAQNRGFIPGDYTLITVCDTGCGMDNKTMSQVFEPFFTTKALNQGTGLGLAMVYGIVKQNKGFIHVYSEPGQGTAFKIYLQRHTSSSVPTLRKWAKQPQIPPRGTETLLLVEDEPMLIQVTAQVLTRLGYNVLSAKGANEALELITTHSEPIDLLVTDIVMPGMNGKELADAIKAVRPKLKVLYMSGYTARVIEQHGILDSSVHFISKPCSTLDLSTKIRYVLDHPAD